MAVIRLNARRVMPGVSLAHTDGTEMMSRRCLLLVALAVGLPACGDVGTPPLPLVRAPDPRAEAIADISRRVRRLAGTGLTECGVFLSG